MNKIVIISAVASLAISLNAATPLEKVTITTATKTKQSIQDTTSNVDVITQQDIQERRFTTVTEALNSIAGISTVSNGGIGQTTSLFLRGMDSKRVLVLIDGIRYNDVTALNGAPFEHLMISDIEQIEVVKGAQSGIWGADASAGVINIITKDAKDGFSGNLHVEAGSFSSKKYGGSISYKNSDFYIKLNSTKVDTDGFTAQAPKGTDIDTFEDDGYKNTTSSLKAGYQFNKNNKIDLSHTIIDASTQYDGFNSPNDDKQIADTKDQFSALHYQNINDYTTIDLTANKSDFDRDYPQGFTKEFDGEVLEYSLKTTTPYNKKDFLVAGVDYKSFEHKNEISKKYKNEAIFISNSNELDSIIDGKTIISESLRYDKYDKFDNKTTGKIGIKQFYNSIKDLTTSINYATAYNIPTLYNLYSAYGSTTLNPESTKSFDITVEYKGLKVTYFNTKIDDIIDYDTTIFKYNNLDGTSKLSGLELEYKKAVGEDILTTINYTLLSAKDKDDKDLIRRPKHSIKFAIDYYGLANAHINLNGEYIEKRLDQMFDENFNTITIQTDNYIVLNLAADYSINKQTKAYIKVDNLTDKQYQNVYGYATSPRAFYAGIQYNF